MNDRQREYFRAKLLAWKDEILRESRLTLQTLQEENVNHPDLADRASSETDRAIELRARDRQRKLISKIDAALQRIEDNTYGYCEETGEPISLKRIPRVSRGKPASCFSGSGAGSLPASNAGSNGREFAGLHAVMVALDAFPCIAAVADVAVDRLRA